MIVARCKRTVKTSFFRSSLSVLFRTWLKQMQDGSRARSIFSDRSFVIFYRIDIGKDPFISDLNHLSSLRIFIDDIPQCGTGKDFCNEMSREKNGMSFFLVIKWNNDFVGIFKMAIYKNFKCLC